MYELSFFVKKNTTHMDELKQFPFKDSAQNIFLVGFMGSGKSHWGEIWAEANKLFFLDLDEEIERTFGKSIGEIFEEEGEDHFRKIEAETLRCCAKMSNTIIACGGGTPCFYDNMNWMNRHGLTIYIESNPTDILERVAAEPGKRPLFKKLDQSELLAFIEEKLQERETFYMQAKFRVSSAILNRGALPEIIHQYQQQ